MKIKNKTIIIKPVLIQLVLQPIQGKSFMNRARKKIKLYLI